MRIAPGRPGTAQLTVASSRAKHAHETLPVGHNTPQEAPQAFAEVSSKPTAPDWRSLNLRHAAISVVG